MAKKKKKNRTLLLLILVMIGMAAAYLGMNQWNAKKAAQEAADSEAESIATLDTTKAVQITFANESGSMTLVKENDTWKKESEEAFPVNQTYVSNMLSAMADIKSTKTVTQKPDDLSQYGLEQPTITVEVTLEDKTAQKVTLGIEIPVAGGYYGMVGEDTTVYALDTAIFDNFSYTEQQMIQMETAPTITTANITHLTVNTGDKATSFEAVYDTEGTGASDYFLWDIKQPFETEVSGDPTQISTLLENYGNFTYDECVDYDSEDPSTYGISKEGKSIQIAYYEEEVADTTDATATDDATTTDNATDTTTETETTKVGKSYTLYIGDVNEDGNYYVQPEGSKAVYLMSASSLDTMMTINAFDYVNKNIYLDNIDDVTSIEFTVDGKTHTLTVTKTDSEEEDATDSYKMDGVAMTEDDFQAAYAKLVGVVLTGEIKEDTSDNTPYLTMTVRTTASEKTVTFLPYDGDNFYRVSEDGVEYFLVDKRSVDEMVESFLNNK